MVFIIIFVLVYLSMWAGFVHVASMCALKEGDFPVLGFKIFENEKCDIDITF